MSVSILPELIPAELYLDRCLAIRRPAVRPVRAAYVRRRGSCEQGRALEALGHALEYLVDSRMLNDDSHPHDPQAAAGEREAVQILMRLSRTVFSECPEVVPLGRRVRQWIAAHGSHRAAVKAES